VSLEAVRWMRELARVNESRERRDDRLRPAFGPGAANEPRAFYRHTVGGDLLARPGRQDLTASVDFEELIREGERLGSRPPISPR